MIWQPKNVLILAGSGGHTAYGYALAQRLYGRANLHFLVPEGDMLSYERLSKFGRWSLGSLSILRKIWRFMRRNLLRILKQVIRS